jgi:hypothetical protein
MGTIHCALTIPGITEDKEPFRCSKSPPNFFVTLTVSFALFDSRATLAIASSSKPAASSFIFRCPSDLKVYNLLHLHFALNLPLPSETTTYCISCHPEIFSLYSKSALPNSPNIFATSDTLLQPCNLFHVPLYEVERFIREQTAGGHTSCCCIWRIIVER